MEKEPKVTVFTSCYNHEKYVAEAIESVLNQTYKNLEFIIVNDGSTDKSAEIIRTYLYDERIHFIDLKENTNAVGAFKIINDFISNTDSKYIAGFSTDDKWANNKLERQVDFLEHNCTYKACFTWDTMIFEDGANKKLREGYSHVENRDRFSWFRRFVLYGNSLNAVSAVIYRDVYLELGEYNWIYRNLQDYDLWLKLSMKYPFYVLPECLTYYRRHMTSLSSNDTAVFRSANEIFYILWSDLVQCSDEDFKKGFYKEFTYADCKTHEDILAEKITILLKSKNKHHHQIAFCLLMQNSKNKKLMDLLSEKYSLGMRKIHELTGVSGLAFLTTNNAEEQSYHINSTSVLMDYISGSCLPADLKKYKYQALLFIAKMMREQNDLNGFLQVKNFIWSLQDELDNQVEHCIFVVGESVVDEFVECRLTADSDVVIVMSESKNIFIDNAFVEPEMDIPCNRKHMFDCAEHRMRFLWEDAMDNYDIVLFYGCLNWDYPIVDFMEAISLGSKLYRLPSSSVDAEELTCCLRELQ